MLSKYEEKQTGILQAAFEPFPLRFKMLQGQLASEMKDQLKILCIKLSLKSTSILPQRSKGVAITSLF